MSIILEANEKIRNIRQRQMDEWIVNQVAKPYIEFTKDIKPMGINAARAVGELAGMVTYARVQKLYSMRTLYDTIAARVQMITQEALNDLVTNAGTILGAGYEDAARLAALQLNVEPKQLVTHILERTPPPEVVDIAQALPAKAMSIGPYVADRIEDNLAKTMSITQGKALDQKIESLIDDAATIGLTFLLGMFSMALWSIYRKGAFTMILANEWTDGWIWVSRRDSRTCASCIWLHGQLFPKEERFMDHPHGRCTPIPHVSGTPWWFGVVYPDVVGGDILDPVQIPQTGEEWFWGLPEDKRREIVGDASYKALDAGEITLADLSETYNHDIYGPIRRQASLVHILGEGAKKYYPK
jgi:hypothetical protein